MAATVFQESPFIIHRASRYIAATVAAAAAAAVAVAVVAAAERSNREIQEFDPEGKDPELVDAVAENIIALAKKEERLQQIKDKMEALGACRDSCTAATVPAAAAAAAAAAAPASAAATAARTPPATETAATTPAEAAPAAAASTATPDAAAEGGSGLSERMQSLDLTDPSSKRFDEGIDL